MPSHFVAFTLCCRQKPLPPHWAAAKQLDCPFAEAHAIRLIPLGTLSIIDLRVGGKLAGRSTEVQLRMAAVHSENHQLSIKDLRWVLGGRGGWDLGSVDHTPVVRGVSPSGREGGVLLL